MLFNGKDTNKMVK